MFNFLTKLFKRGKKDKDKTPQDWVREGRCPDCHAKDSLYEGPSGAGSTNYLCGNCGHKYNIAHGMGLLLIDDLGHDEVAWNRIKDDWNKIKKQNAERAENLLY